MMKVRDWVFAAVSTTVICGISYVSFSPAKAVTEPCVSIYYDRRNDGYTRSLEELIRSYTPEATRTRDIKNYQAGDIEQCRVNFYIGSLYDNVVPRTFIADFSETQQKVVWLGYNIWEMGTLIEQNFGYRFVRLTRLETASNGHEGYFKDIYYKGKIFERDIDHHEQVELVLTREKKSEVLAEVRHSMTRERIPYILRNHNKHYVADIPLGGSVEEGRYKVFRDFVGEVLELPSRRRGDELANLSR